VPSARRNNHLVSLALAESVRIFVQGTSDQLRLGPQVGGEESVGVGDGSESGLEGVLEGLGRTGGRGVGVLDTCQLKESLDGGRSDDLSTTGSRDEL
jgi:hypothetical protein